MKSFYNEIKDAKVEKEVEIVYKNELKKSFLNSNISHNYNCDGYLEGNIVFNSETKVLRLIMEFKLDEDFSSKIKQSKVLIQVLYYLKKFSEYSTIFPEIILVGDKNECFVLTSDKISKYLTEEINWGISPSEAPSKNPSLLMKLNEDNDINPFIFSVDSRFNFKVVTEKIKELAFNIKTYVKITEKNMAEIYDYFIIKVVRSPENYSVNELVFIFLNLLINPIDSYLHPKKKNTLVLKDNKQVSINETAFNSFFDYYEFKYSPKEIEMITSISDRLIEDTQRRFKGEFYTPTVWADEANKNISELYGEDWRDKYVVWDCAWGTGNLTRDYNFKELYCSTLYKGDLVIGDKYNTNAVKFQYDFLNDDVDLLQGADLLENMAKMPKELLNSLKSDRPIIFFINPPFATPSNGKTKNKKSKKGNSITAVQKVMQKNKLGKCSEQIYAQFIYKILMIKERYKLSNIKLAIFSPPLLLSGPSYKTFRKRFLVNFKYREGILFNASHFYDTSSDWGISFSVWDDGETGDKCNFKYKIKDISGNNTIVTLGEKIIYNLDDTVSASDCFKQKKLTQNIEIPALKSAVSIDGKVLNTDEKALAYFINDCNNVYANTQGVYIMSSKVTRHVRTIPIYSDNIVNCMSLFAARNLIKSNWINQKDEYSEPNKNHPRYKEWVSDSVIYSLFNQSSNQSSMRNIKIQGKLFNIFNELFFMSNKSILELANETNNNEVYIDAKQFNKERYMYYLLGKLKLSNEGKQVLNMAIELTKESFKYRNLFNDEFPKYHINTWDAGWYQINKLLNYYLRDELLKFDECYEILENKMRPLVYELGFLRG
ncbi:hypothetical protein JHL18_02505 [Clostridium sp. YIM B02505]|uniref:Site-specific DNA-methyltransferase (adenine-specific) n=1 Tax=Clostridium yunnanense TaxID=2800325 RepID=A0ABS1EJH5_9CLOT|nr:hypothetical protein [Clostridium yunnanense]MBK1809516.1 hypothetical protein [Clostridium yunnanense]